MLISRDIFLPWCFCWIDCYPAPTTRISRVFWGLYLLRNLCTAHLQQKPNIKICPGCDCNDSPVLQIPSMQSNFSWKVQLSLLEQTWNYYTYPPQMQDDAFSTAVSFGWPVSVLLSIQASTRSFASSRLNLDAWVSSQNFFTSVLVIRNWRWWQRTYRRLVKSRQLFLTGLGTFASVGKTGVSWLGFLR